ncbi:hypothetical protein HK101_000303, partial [Irineochytrium annulatum]
MHLNLVLTAIPALALSAVEAARAPSRRDAIAAVNPGYDYKAASKAPVQMSPTYRMTSTTAPQKKPTLTCKKRMTPLASPTPSSMAAGRPTMYKSPAPEPTGDSDVDYQSAPVLDHDNAPEVEDDIETPEDAIEDAVETIYTPVIAPTVTPAARPIQVAAVHKGAMPAKPTPTAYPSPSTPPTSITYTSTTYIRPTSGRINCSLASSLPWSSFPHTQQGLVDALNHMRAAISNDMGGALPSVSWDDGIASTAQAYAERLRDGMGCGLQHSGAGGLGENLYEASAGVGGDVWGFNIEGLKAYTGECIYLQSYDLLTYPIPNGGDAFETFGHITQLLWPESTRFACGVAQCQDNWVQVCNFAS